MYSQIIPLVTYVVGLMSPVFWLCLLVMYRFGLSCSLSIRLFHNIWYMNALVCLHYAKILFLCFDLKSRTCKDSASYGEMMCYRVVHPPLILELSMKSRKKDLIFYKKYSLIRCVKSYKLSWISSGTHIYEKLLNEIGLYQESRT